MTEANAPRPDKVAKVEEITAKLKEARAVFVTEYRGMSVSQMADLRTPLRAVGAEHKVYKNTLVKLAAANAGLDGLNDQLTGPTALTFATEDSVGAAKAIHRIVKLISEAKSERVQLDASRDILDRAGFKPPERFAVQIAGDMSVSIDLS